MKALKSNASWLTRLKGGLQKTRKNLVGQLTEVFKRHPSLDEKLWENIEEILLYADVGVQATLTIVERLRQVVYEEKIQNSADLFDLLKKELIKILHSETPSGIILKDRPKIIIVVGVNGTGKTTTIAKIAHRFIESDKKVLLAAADTFRAAAIDQLDFWGEKVGATVIKHQRRSDPAAVVYDAIQASRARQIDLLLIDTAGRLHTYVNLMEELKKVKRIAEREAQDAEVETLLVLDATTGQNGIAQAKLFNQTLTIDGIVLTKLDGTAKGGIIIAIADELGIPIKLVGVGEEMEDLLEFHPQEFVEALLAL